MGSDRRKIDWDSMMFGVIACGVGVFLLNGAAVWVHGGAIPVVLAITGLLFVMFGIWRCLTAVHK